MLGKVPNPTTLGIFFPVRQNDDVPKKGPRLDSPRVRPCALLAPKQSKEQAKAHPRSVPSQGASKRQSKAQHGPLPTQGAAKPRRRHSYKAPCRAASILGTVCKEENPTTLGKVRNPTTLGIFFPVRQNDDVPQKGPRLDSPRVRPCALLAPKQSKEQAKAHPRSVPSQGASKRQSKAQPGPFLRKAQPSPVEGTFKRHLAGRPLF